MILTEKIKKYGREKCHTGGKFGQTRRKFWLACRKIKHFFRPWWRGYDTYQYGVPTNEFAGLTKDAEPKSAEIEQTNKFGKIHIKFTCISVGKKELIFNHLSPLLRSQNYAK